MKIDFELAYNISKIIFLTPKSATLIAFNCNKESEVKGAKNIFD